MLRYVRKQNQLDTYLTRGYLGADYPVPDGYELVEGSPLPGMTQEIQKDVPTLIREAVRTLSADDYYLIKDELTAGMAVMSQGFNPAEDAVYLTKLFTEAATKLDTNDPVNAAFVTTVQTILGGI